MQHLVFWLISRATKNANNHCASNIRVEIWAYEARGKMAYTFSMIKEAASVPLIKYYSVDKSRRMGWVRF
jgi:hypothetical protein